MNSQSLYRARYLFKLVFPVLTVLAACFLFAGIPSLIILMTTNSMASITGTVKGVMASGLALFLFLIGFMGFYFWTRTDYKHYDKLWMVGTAFIFVATLGLQMLFNSMYG